MFTITGGLYAGTQAGIVSTRDEIDFDNLNPNGLTRIPPRFVLELNSLWHNAPALVLGGASVVTVAAYIATFTRTSACQSPAGTADAIKAIAAGALIGKEGIKTEAAMVWIRKGQMYLADVRGVQMRQMV